MCSPRTYDDILFDILDKRHSRCVCPGEYLPAPPSPRSKPTTPCQFGPNCQFEICPTTSCTYDAAVCTCVQCTCGMDPPARGLPAPSPPGCVCPGPCRCESGEELPLECETSACICLRCTCEPKASSPNLLPTSFRTVLKREGRMLMTDQEMREERQAIKQLIDEVKSAPKDSDMEGKKVLKRKKSKSDKLDEDSGGKEEQKQTVDSPKESLKIAKAPKVSIAIPAESTLENKTSNRRQSARLSRENSIKKSKKNKSPKRMTAPKSTKSAMQYRSRVKTTEKKRPLRIRYYYAGAVESYGVKLGHIDCLEKPVSVPKNMGWLWNIEDPSKGIRERKGWPPGFIGKNIKNMIQVMKMFASVDPTNQTGDARELRRWKTQPDTRAEQGEQRDEPPLLHIHKKGRTYDITFCPKNSDDDIGPVPIPFSITQKKRDGDSETDDSSLELEFHSPKPRARWNLPQAEQAPSTVVEETQPQPPPPPPPGETGELKPPSGKGKKKKKKSAAASEENRNNWEDHPTQIENVPSSTIAGS